MEQNIISEHVSDAEWIEGRGEIKLCTDIKFSVFIYCYLT